ncbi:hypothetical protein I4U23_011983 [Adineta vaga]|nr:hypothetical protein I4U23_011983 [Adineta vaga]
MSNYNPKTPMQTARPPIEHFYTKFQVHYAGDIHEIVLKTTKEPTCGDLAKTLQSSYRVPMDKQMVFYRGQPLHQHSSANYERPLSKYGMFSGNLIRLTGRRGLI